MRPRSHHDIHTSSSSFAALLLFLPFLALFLGIANAESANSALPHIDTLLDERKSDGIRDAGDVAYEPVFPGLDRSIIGRAPADEAPVALENNIAKNLNLLPGNGNASYYSFSIPGSTKRDLTVRNAHEKDGTQEETASSIIPRQQSSGATVYISINTCLQPSFSDAASRNAPPQPSLYVSSSGDNKAPGPDSNGEQTIIPLVEGFASHSLQVSDEVYIGVAAPQAEIVEDTAWNYELAVSVNASYHSYNETGPTMFLTDSDPGAALLVTKNLSWMAPDNGTDEAISKWAVSHLPLSVFVANVNNTAVNGVKRSYCGLKSASAIIDSTNTPIRNGITHNQQDSVAEQQFYVPGLNRSSTYYGFLARNGNGSESGSGVISGGGTIFPNMMFPTKRDANCAVIHNLTFCNTVEYAVPANPATFPNVDDLKALYDSEAAERYQNFNYSLQQIPCNTTSTAQYSLARTCDDCASSYKKWLCAVTIPRCEDFSSPVPVQIPIGPNDSVDDEARMASGEQGYLMPRNLAQAPIRDSDAAPDAILQDVAEMSWLATNSSRNNATIAGKIQPGPYHEVLPCDFLCYGIVRDCPASLGFACPEPGSRMLRASYGRPGHSANGAIHCSAPGLVYSTSKAETGAGVHMWTLWGCVVFVSTLLMVQ